MQIDDSLIQKAYEKINECCNVIEAPKYLIDISEKHQNGLWRNYLETIKKIPIDWNNKVVVDYGCKYGHLFPLLYGIGVEKSIGIEVEEDYLKWGRELFKEAYDNVEILKPEKIGYIPLQPETVDVVIMNEVISHVNPMYLELVISEVARILRVDGYLFISDGNNLAYPGYKEKLVSFYDAWENGPDGIETDRDVVEKSYLTRRIELIEARSPDLSRQIVDYLAENTSGLWGDYLFEVIDQYICSGKLIRRPYRKGICPTNPGNSGVVMEKAFYPQQVLYLIGEYGFKGCVEKPKPALRNYLPVNIAKYSIRLIQYYFKELFKPDWEMAISEGF